MSDLKLARGFSLPLDVVTEAIGIVATRGAGKSYTSAVLLEETYAAGIPFVVLDPSGVYHGLRSSADGNKAGLKIYVLGGPHGDLPLEDHAGQLIADLVVDSGHSFVLDLSDFTKTKMRKFVAVFLERLYDRKARSRTTLLLVVDEADEFAPQKPRGDTIDSLAAMETIAKRGRARGLGIVMITQRTQALNKDVLDLIETLVAMRQLAERSRESVKGWIADKELRDDVGIIESLQSLPTGTAWVWSPLRGILKEVAIRRIRTFDSYATPKPGMEKAEPAARAELDLEALGERMKATVERAKLNDPSELRRRIRDLERDLTAAQLRAESMVENTEVQTVEVEKIVEVDVPALTDAEWEQLRRLASQIGEFEDKLAAAHDVLEALTVGFAKNAAERSQRSQFPNVAVDDSEPSRMPLAPPTVEIRRERVDTTSSREPRQARSQAAGRAQVVVDGEEVKVGKGEMKVLQALAEFPDGRTHNELAFLTGYSAGASTIGTFISKLRAAGLVEQGQGPSGFRATAAGIAAAGGVRERPTGPALLDEWLRHPKMELGMRLVLNALVERYPREPTHEELCEITGYSPTASTVGTFLSKLRKLGLVEGGRKLSPEFAEAIR